MPILAAFFGALFTNIVSYLTLYMTKRVAIIVAVIAAFVVITNTFAAAVNTAIAGIALALPEELSIAASWVVPENFNECLGAYLAAHGIAWVYSWNIRIIQYKML